jgi:hypothetical protein
MPILHHYKGVLCGFLNAIDRANVRVLEHRRGLSFFNEVMFGPAIANKYAND